MFLRNCGYFRQLGSFPRNHNLSIEGFSLSQWGFYQSLQQLPPAFGCFNCWEMAVFFGCFVSSAFPTEKVIMPISSLKKQNGARFYQSIFSGTTVCSMLSIFFFFHLLSFISSFDISFNLWPLVHPHQHHHYFVGFTRLFLRGLFPEKLFVPLKVFWSAWLPQLFSSNLF